MDNTIDEKYISAKELMAMLNIGRDKAYDLLQTNAIKSSMVGRNYRIAVSDVKAYIDKNVVK